LDQRVKHMDMGGKIFEVVIPTEEEIEIREGQRRTVSRKLFPGYVLVQMIMDDDSWYVVRNTPGVTGFAGNTSETDRSRPMPLGDEEVARILRQMHAAAPRINVGFKVGEAVRVTDGPFVDFVGQVDEINLDKGKVRVMVSMFGRETPVELDFLQVEKQ
jgi:transcriptional antiterminator NusG